MKATLLAATLLAPTLVATQASAAVPNSIAVLLGPTIGYQMAQNDLCGWNLAAKMTAVYTKGFLAIGLTAAQQDAVWTMAKERSAALGQLSPDARNHMKASVCTDQIKAKLEHDLQD